MVVDRPKISLNVDSIHLNLVRNMIRFISLYWLRGHGPELLSHRCEVLNSCFIFEAEVPCLPFDET